MIETLESRGREGDGSGTRRNGGLARVRFLSRGFKSTKGALILFITIIKRGHRRTTGGHKISLMPFRFKFHPNGRNSDRSSGDNRVESGLAPVSMLHDRDLSESVGGCISDRDAVVLSPSSATTIVGVVRSVSFVREKKRGRGGEG